MDKITISRDNERDLRFHGELIAQATSPKRTGRWTVLSLYRTAGGKLGAGQIGRTNWEGEHDRHAAQIGRAHV